MARKLNTDLRASVVKLNYARTIGSAKVVEQPRVARDPKADQFRRIKARHVVLVKNASLDSGNSIGLRDFCQCELCWLSPLRGLIPDGNLVTNVSAIATPHRPQRVCAFVELDEPAQAGGGKVDRDALFHADGHTVDE